MHPSTALQTTQDHRCSPLRENVQAIHACRQSQNWQNSLEILSATASQNLKVNVVLYTATISTVSAEQWPQALRLLEDLRIQSVETDTILHNAVVSCLEKGEQLGSPLVPFTLLGVLGSLLKVTNQNRVSLFTIWLLGYQGYGS